MSNTTQWHDFWRSLLDRYGDHTFYDPKYLEIGTDKDIFHLPWWSPITFFVSRWHARAYMIRKALSPMSGWLRFDDNWGLHKCGDSDRWWFFRGAGRRIWYVLKSILCVLFCWRRTEPENFYDWMNVACYDFGPGSYEYGGSDWTSLDVGRGIFANWYFREYDDSSY